MSTNDWNVYDIQIFKPLEAKSLQNGSSEPLSPVTTQLCASSALSSMPLGPVPSQFFAPQLIMIVDKKHQS